MLEATPHVRESGSGLMPLSAEVSKSWRFDAAHQLPNHSGQCARLHGHTYTVTVRACGPIKPVSGASDDGMVIDFAELGEAWEKVEPLLDHRNLNETIGSAGCWPTTAENIAAWILTQFEAHGIQLSSVTVHETPTSSATVTKCEEA